MATKRTGLYDRRMSRFNLFRILFKLSAINIALYDKIWYRA
jgi:hypothetical protein